MRSVVMRRPPCRHMMINVSDAQERRGDDVLRAQERSASPALLHEGMIPYMRSSELCYAVHNHATVEWVVRKSNLFNLSWSGTHGG